MSEHDASCLDALLNLYPYLDGELSEEEADKVRLHFELCSPCTPALHFLQSFKDALHRAASDQPAAPATLKARIANLLETPPS